MDPETTNLILVILLLLMVLASVLAVMIRNLVKAAIALAATSVVLTIIMFVLKSPLAAVFELSVCAGLITAVFISAITMMEVSSEKELETKRRERARRFIYLPIILVLLAAGLILAWPSLRLNIASITSGNPDVGYEVWNIRQLDMIGQIIIIIAGVFGVVVLFKERRAK